MAKKACIFGAKRSMKADILKSVYFTDTDSDETPTPPVDAGVLGYWEYHQDPDSGAIEKEWVGSVVDDPTTPDIDESSSDYILKDQPCEIRGIMEGGIRVAGTTTRFSETYENVEWVKGTFSPHTDITKGDKVTNIRNQDNVLIWRNEENVQPWEASGATTFNDMGVTPVLDPFGQLVEWSALMQRAEIQSNVAVA
jgi:hypothetical protein